MPQSDASGGGGGALTVDGSREMIADPETDSAFEQMSYHVVEASDKRRRLIVSVFTAFVIILCALAVLMVSATLSIGAS
jgi:hypothetical protein